MAHLGTIGVCFVLAMVGCAAERTPPSDSLDRSEASEASEGNNTTTTAELMGVAAGSTNWTGPALVENGRGSVGAPILSVDADDRIWVGWSQFASDPPVGASDLWVRQFAKGAWQTAEMLAPSATPAQIVGAVAGGPVFLIYSQNGGTDISQVWARRRNAGIWEAPRRIDNATSSGYADRASAGMDAAGNVHVLYYVANSSTEAYDIYTVRYSPAGGWGSPVAIENSPDVAIRSQISVAPNGSAVAAWVRSLNGLDQLWVAQYSTTNGWSVGENVNTTSDSSTGDFAVGTDAAGRALVTWADYSDSTWTVYAITSTGFSWSKPTKVTTGAEQSLSLAMNASGQALVAYQKYIRGNYRSYTASYSPSLGWQSEVRVSTASSIAPFALALDPLGNALLARWQENGTADMVANFRRAGSSWGPSVALEHARGAVSYPAAAMRANGQAFVVWDQDASGGASNLWVNIRR